MKIRENCYMLGIGSTGGKIYKEFVQRHYKGAAANGSEQDHKALGDVPNKYTLQGFDGFGGHRERAMDCLAENDDFIKFIEGIKEDIVFILFAGGGSTGSGCAPIVAEMLLEEKDEEGNPVKTVCPVIALPASGESLAKHKNAYETVQELQEIEGLGATFFLNNDSNENYDYINKNFANMLDEFLSNESYGRLNNFDESERLEMLKDSGAMVLSVTGDGTDNKINRSYYNRKFQRCGAAKTRMLNLYHLKDAVLKKLQEEDRVEYLGVNRQVFDYGPDSFLRLYRIGDFTFHIPCQKDEVNELEILDEEIDGEISAEKTRNVDINFRQAMLLLENYSGVKAAGTYNKKPEFY